MSHLRPDCVRVSVPEIQLGDEMHHEGRWYVVRAIQELDRYDARRFTLRIGTAIIKLTLDVKANVVVQRWPDFVGPLARMHARKDYR